MLKPPVVAKFATNSYCYTWKFVASANWNSQNSGKVV
jgi:hypothetical protein